jgi:predicted dehydrogenase
MSRLQKLKQVVDSGELGSISGYHMKMVASGRGGWDVPGDSYEWRFQQMRDGRGPLFFDDGWHKLSTALWLFGPIKEVRAWIGATEIVPGIAVDAPSHRHLGTREWRTRRVGHHARRGHVPAFGLLHE